MYRFKLEALLNHRRHQEETCQKALAQAQQQLAAEQLKLRRKKEEKRENLCRLQEAQHKSISVSSIILYVNYIAQLTKSIEDQNLCVREVTKKVNQKRNELIAAVKKRKTLEKLKEREWQAYQKKMLLNERKFMDDIASTRYARKM
jgi:flagellar FliJ protein